MHLDGAPAELPEDGALDLRHQSLIDLLLFFDLFAFQHLQSPQVLDLPNSQPRVL